MLGKRKSTSSILNRPSGLLTVLGAINWDVSIFEDSFAGLGEEVPVREVEEFSGGKGANVAVAAARLLGRETAAFIGALGTDAIAKVQLRELRKEGVVTDGVVMVEGSRSGRAYIVVNREGKKSIHTHFGANSMIRPQDLDAPGPAGVLSRTSMLVVMDTPTDVALAALRKVRSTRARVIYSPGVRVREGREALKEIAASADFMVLDKAELARLSGKSDPVQAARFLQGASPNLTVLATSGKGGCIVVDRDGMTRFPGVDLSKLKMKAVNSTGSGDSFLGVLASFLAGGAGPRVAARWANLAGALKAARYETRGSPTRAKLISAMRLLDASKQRH
jgi:ribokinase